MVVAPRLCVMLAGVSAVSLFVFGAVAQDAPAPPVQPPDFDKIVAHFKEQDEDLRKSTEDLRNLIETELAAKRLDPNTAQNMLYAFRPNAVTGAVDLQALAAARITMRTPNEPVAAAARKLDVLTTEIKDNRYKLRDEALGAARKRTAQVARTARSAADIDPLIAAMENLQNTLGPRTGNGFQITGEFGSAITLLRNIKAGLIASESGDPKLLGTAIDQLRPMSPTPNDFLGWTAVDAQTRINGFVKPYTEAAQSAQNALDQALIAGQPAKDLTKLLAALETAENNLQAAHVNGFGAARNGDPLPIYRTLVGLARAVEEHDTAYLKANLNARHNLASLGAERANDFDHLFAQWEKQLDAAAGQATAGKRSSWPDRLAAVKSPEDLQGVVLDLQRSEREANTGRDPDLPRGLAVFLNAVTVAWRNDDLSLIMGGQGGFDSGSWDGTYIHAINQLQERIQRDVMSHILHVPELLKPPLEDQPLRMALDTLAHDLSAAHEWRRLLTLLEQRATRLPGQESVTTTTQDAISAVRSYLAGQNFELAEQWSDAILAYKAVLSSAAEIGPIQDAAERLKVLMKEHPPGVAVKTPANAAPVHKGRSH